jgi:hypothetical protein
VEYIPRISSSPIAFSSFISLTAFSTSCLFAYLLTTYSLTHLLTYLLHGVHNYISYPET